MKPGAVDDTVAVVVEPDTVVDVIAMTEETSFDGSQLPTFSHYNYLLYVHAWPSYGQPSLEVIGHMTGCLKRLLGKAPCALLIAIHVATTVLLF